MRDPGARIPKARVGKRFKTPLLKIIPEKRNGKITPVLCSLRFRPKTPIEIIIYLSDALARRTFHAHVSEL